MQFRELALFGLVLIGSSCDESSNQGVPPHDVVVVATDLAEDESRVLKTIANSFVGDGDRIEIESSRISDSKLTIRFSFADPDPEIGREHLELLSRAMRNAVDEDKLEIHSGFYPDSKAK